jgi:radical SAM protein with 4Fe4S-binding SPASM domain
MIRLDLLKYVSFKKAFNLIRVFLGYYISLIIKKSVVWGYPYSITTEPTNQCNLNCLECPTGNKLANVPKGKMNFNIYKKIIGDVKSFVIYQMLYFQGEPFLHPDLFKMIKYSDDNNIYTSISTNGHFLTQENSTKIIESGLKRIIISVDGTSQDSYEKYRVGGKLNIVLKGIRTLTKAKKELNSKYPKVIIQFLVFSHNEYEISEIKALSKELSVNTLEIKSAQIDQAKNYGLIPKTEKYTRYKKINSKYYIKSKLRNKCFRLWSTLVITWSGSVIPCCFDKNNNYKMGNIISSDTLKIWGSEDFNNFRTALLKSRKGIEICCNCSEGLCK